ncbi:MULTISPECIES: hypothetical protein [Cryobacterium]|uniref:Uncharacterized protein n=1 Tax=Cryobacterium breve TaxID=1259258 RepID=A0ABY2J4E8_9MICO|nr:MULTISPECIES: hypothetical protein [Cryobacterium]TFC92049.1 hypothetical protein E3T20_12100 [Cryobacterium sp. TmT3-12]TFC99812.1 hypothetical protein E3O65_05405 [Cryobacterium breve]
MSQSIESLHAMSDAEVIAEHDAVAKSTSVGTAYWMDELERRSRDRSTAASNRLATASFWLSIVSTVIAVVAVAVSLSRG